MAPSAPFVAAVVLAACGGSSGDRGGADAAPAPVALPTAKLPAELAANVKQADAFVGAGVDEFKERLERLRGHPVVVNQWASWCDPCRFEIPFFRAMTAKYADRVAFVGIDLQDDRGAAEEFMRELPSGFPSVFDPDGSVTRSLGGGRASPRSTSTRTASGCSRSSARTQTSASSKRTSGATRSADQATGRTQPAGDGRRGLRDRLDAVRPRSERS